MVPRVQVNRDDGRFRPSRRMMRSLSMKAFAVVKLHCLAFEILKEVCELPAVLAPDAESDPVDEASLKDFRPLHELSAGPREAKFQRAER